MSSVSPSVTLNRCSSNCSGLWGLDKLAFIEPSNLISHSPHDSLAWRNSHQAGHQPLPQCKQPFLSINPTQSMHHPLVADLTCTLSHQPCLHNIKWASANRTSKPCQKPWDHWLVRLKSDTITLMFVPKKIVAHVLGREHDSLIGSISHYSRSSSCPQSKNSFFPNDCSGTMYRSFVFQKLST